MTQSISSKINDSDLLGRACFSSKQARSARSDNIRHDLFLEKTVNHSLSVDRFNFCSYEELTKIQDKNAKLRSQATTQSKPRSFYGWARLKAQQVRLNGRQVKPTALKDNPYHADIILPKDIDRDDQKAHAHELASYAEWVPRV